MRHLFLLLLIHAAYCTNAQGNWLVAEVRCDYQVNPVGIEARNPALSWVLTSTDKNQFQTAYQVLVASSPELLNESAADLWNSGKVDTDQSIQIS